MKIDGMMMSEMSKADMERLTAESIERMISIKLEELDDNDPTRWRKFLACDQNGPVAGHDALRELMRLMVKAMGFEKFIATPAAVLEQFALSAVARNEDIGSLLEIMLTAPLIAYGHPDTAAALIDRVNEIRDLCMPLVKDHLYEDPQAQQHQKAYESASHGKRTVH